MSKTQDTLAAVDRFNEAFNSHDVDAVMRLMTDDVVFDNTSPPDGERLEGQDAVRGFWERLFRRKPERVVHAEDTFAVDDRCVVQWLFIFDKNNPEGGHVRGVDLFRVRDGQVAEKLSYVKG